LYSSSGVFAAERPAGQDVDRWHVAGAAAGRTAANAASVVLTADGQS